MPNKPQSPIGDASLARALDAGRILTTSNAVAQRISLPAGYVQRGRLLFAALQADVPPPTDEMLGLSSQHGLDVVLVRYDAMTGARSITAGLGIWLWDCLPWCGETRLWRPSDTAICVLVPAADPLTRHYSIQRGMIYAIDGPPWLDDLELGTGFERARQALQRLMAGR